MLQQPLRTVADAAGIARNGSRPLRRTLEEADLLDVVGHTRNKLHRRGARADYRQPLAPEIEPFRPMR
jgi:hypothetical protein